MKKKYGLYLIVLSVIFIFVHFPVFAEDVSINGFISQGFLKTNKNNFMANTEDGTFQFNEMGISFRTSPSKDLKIGCQLFAHDLGEIGNDEIMLNWAFAEYSLRDWLGIRAGLIKLPFGFYNDIRDFDVLRTSIWLPMSVYNEWSRDGNNSIKGIEFFGNIQLGPVGTLKYQLSMGQTQLALDSGSIKYIEAFNGLTGINYTNVDTMYSGSLRWITPLDGLKIGGTCLYVTGMQYSTSTGIEVDVKEMTLSTISVEYIIGNFIFTAEAYPFDRDADVFFNGNPMSDASGKLDIDDNHYASVAYRVMDNLELGFYYSKAWANPDKKGPGNRLEQYCLSSKYDINPNWIAKVEVQSNKGTYLVSPGDDGDKHENWMLYSAKLSYSF